MHRHGRTARLTWLLAFAGLFSVSIALIVTDSKREILIINGVVKIQETLVLTNDGTADSSSAVLCLSNYLSSHLAFREVAQGAADDFVELTFADSAVDGAPANVTCVSATLQPALKRGQSTTIKQFTVHTHVLTPVPAKITQKDPQMVVFQDYLVPVSPYVVQQGEVQVKLPSTSVASYTKVESSTTKSKDVLKYAPLGKQAPFTLTKLRIHVEHPQMFATVKNLVREIEVSHWGNVYVEEQYELAHTGAQLTGPWSRLDYQMNPMVYGRNAIQSLQMDLPAGARSLYYRDEIGNISTSRVRFTRAKVDVQLEPRFPLFGGWKVKFMFGYSLPLQFVVSKTKGGRLQLSSPFSCAIRNVVVDNMVIKVVLPEGAHNVRTHTPYSGVEVTKDVKYTYLDTVGRPVIVLSKKDVVAEHTAPLTLTYSFSTLGMLQEPMLLISAFAALFGVAIVCLRMDTAISKDGKYKAQLEHERLADKVQKLDSKLTERRRVLRELEVAAATKPVPECKELKGTAESTFKSTEAQIKSLLQEIEGVSGKEAEKFIKLVDEERALVANSLSLYTKKVDLVATGAKAIEIDKKLATQEKAVVDASKALKAACDKLFEAY